MLDLLSIIPYNEVLTFLCFLRVGRFARLVKISCLIGLSRKLNFIDAIWWSVATVSTVGYGESVPKTLVGKVIAVVLMFSGITTLGLLTNSLNNILVRSGRQTERKLAEFEKELVEQRAILEEIRSTVLAMNREMDEIDD